MYSVHETSQEAFAFQRPYHISNRGIRVQKIAQQFGKYFRCPEHNEIIRLFCSDHEQPCCYMCTGTKHRKCESVDTIQNAALNVKENGKLDDLLNEVRNIERKLADAKLEQEKNIAELEDSVDKMTKQSEKDFEELVEHIEKMKNKHLDEIAIAKKRGRREMDQVTSTLKDGIDCANYCCRNIEKVRQTEDEKEFLMNYCIAIATTSQLKQFQFTKKCIKISAKEVPILNELKGVESLKDIEYSESKNAVMVNIRTMVLPNVPELSIKENNSQIYTGSFLADDKFAIIDYSVDGKCIIYDNKWARNKVIVGLKKPYEVVQKADELFVTCENTNSIEVFSAFDFLKLRTIAMNEPVYGIKIWNGAFYVACATKIIKTDFTGNKIKEFETEGKNNVCILTTNNGLIVYSNWFLHTVTAMTEQGEFVWKYESFNMKEPRELDKDSADNIVVAARQSNNIHVLSSAGKLIKVFEGIHQPVFIKMNENRSLCCVCSDFNVVNIYHV